MHIKYIIKELIEILFYSLIIIYFLSICFWPLRVDGISMQPYLRDGDTIVMSKIMKVFKEKKRGDVVICNINYNGNNKKIVKRIIGIPNDHIKIKEGIVSINSEKLDEFYIKDSYTSGEFDLILNKTEYFVMGDNRNFSIDSRNFGNIKEEEIIGKVLLKVPKFYKIVLY